ncbi:actin-binding IPP [Paramuricea clavata]|uniref:Actin-binding IPP n=1 Tax=Paramuricea clavata TaxID=317549 RepID=A0A7D9EPS7_PARCT|nr:actin-binding IPP [Paramuricea clavata]
MEVECQETQDCRQIQVVVRLKGGLIELDGTMEAAKTEVMSKQPPKIQEKFNNDIHKQDILVASGECDGAEIFSWDKNAWYEISEMNESHVAASSFVYNNKLFVIKGISCTETIETLDLNELPLKWIEFSDEFPDRIRDAKFVVYRHRVIAICACNEDDDTKSNMICELQLGSPFTLKELCQMPHSLGFQGTEAFEDKVLILGGIADGDVLDSVLEFDPEKNECKELPPLPHPLYGMGTVHWRDQVVVLGGSSLNDQPLNDVYMYDSKTGIITVLPPMLKRRNGCCAVITGNTIVVMGGMSVNDEYDEEYKCLNSVEYFTMGGSTWKYLPSMNKERWEAVAIALPSTRKYV